MSRENTEKWLSLINDEIPFKWKWENDKVKIYPPLTDKPFLYFFGNLCKGISEGAWYCEDHLKDESDEPFFVKNWRAFSKQEDDVMHEVGYNPNHFWFNWKDKEHLKYPRKSRTIKEAYDKYLNLKSGLVWPNVL